MYRGTRALRLRRARRLRRELYRRCCRSVAGRRTLVPISKGVIWMPTTLTDALARAREWERHHAPAVPRPRLPKGAEDRLADRITEFAGSMRFVYLHTAWFLLWIAINAGLTVAL